MPSSSFAHNAPAPILAAFSPASPRFLRHVLLVDALSCAACGALQLLAPVALAGLLGLPVDLLVGTGVFLLVYALAVAVIGTRVPVPRAPVWLCVVGNFGWALACGALLLGPWVQATGWGTAYVLMQAATVVVLAELQWLGLKRRAASAV